MMFRNGNSRLTLEGIVSNLNIDYFKNDSEYNFSMEVYVKMIVESKDCSPVVQILKKYPIFCCLLFFTYLKSIAETLPHY